MAESCDILTPGNAVTLEAEFYDPLNDEQPYDPIEVRATVTKGPVTTNYQYGVDPALERVSIGIYRLTFDLPEAGDYQVNIFGAADEYLGPRECETVTVQEC